MENASKALIMAGSVLIALMIIGALILMFGNLTSYQGTDTQSTRSAQVTEFNNQFETYNRDDVRGSDLYSLLNKVIDYNRRQTTAGTGNDRGQELAYMPMEVNFTIDITQLAAADGTNRLSKRNIQTSANTYTVSNNENKFEDSIKETIDNLEDDYGQDSLTNLTTNLTKIFKDEDLGPEPGSTEETIIVKNFNEASRKVKITSYSDIDSKETAKFQGTIREGVYTYYEYIQFKRAYFDCKNVEYDSNTGRITKMDFEFTGKFN